MAEAKKPTKEPKTAEKPVEAPVEEVAASVDDNPIEASAQPEEQTVRPVAKAGKRSAKAKAEKEAVAAKETRKESGDSEEAKSKAAAKSARTLLERRSKGYRKSTEQIETGKIYSLNKALELATKTSHVKFDATVEFHIRLNVDPRQADQNLRDIIVLPAGTGKSVRVAVFAAPEDVTKAQKAGADIAGSDEFLQQLERGELNFDVLIATPAQMPKLGKYARALGPKGLMPNPKSGTVTTDVAKAVADAKAGRVEYRVDSTGIIHVGIGKASFTPAQLVENAAALIGSIKGNKPGSIKGAFIKSAYVTTSMGPSIPIDVAGL